MNELDTRLRAALEEAFPVDAPPDWNDVAGRARDARRRTVRRLSALAAALAAAAMLAATTPLGSAIAQSLGGFSSWLSGQPGNPVTPAEQEEFAAGNARSWIGFPEGTQLRRLATRQVGGTTVELLGLRSGTTTFCLRVVVQGASRTPLQRCAALDELRIANSPVLPVLVDHGIGKGPYREWYGIDRVTSPNLQITAGIAADDVEAVVLEDDTGAHEVPASGNAFLYVAQQPQVGQRVRRITARTSNGTVPVPFVAAPFGIGGGSAAPRPAAPPAPTVERVVRDGRIGWLERREAVGQPLTAFRGRSAPLVSRNVEFGRIVAPDPDRPLRMAVTLSSNRHDLRPGAPSPPLPRPSDPEGVCTWLLSAGGAGGGCAPRQGLFADGPLAAESLGGSGSGMFVTVTGLASDDVARIEAVLADGRRLRAALAHNVYLLSLARPSLPARLVAYDAAGRVIGVSRPYHDFGRNEVGPARGRAVSVLESRSSSGATAEILEGPASDGGVCMFVRQRISRRAGGVSVACARPDWKQAPVQLSGWGERPPFVVGRVAPTVARVRVEFADGTSDEIAPTRGYVLYVVPTEHLAEGREVVAATGLATDGSVVGSRSFRPPGGRG